MKDAVHDYLLSTTQQSISFLAAADTSAFVVNKPGSGSQNGSKSGRGE